MLFRMLLCPTKEMYILLFVSLQIKFLQLLIKHRIRYCISFKVILCRLKSTWIKFQKTIAYSNSIIETLEKCVKESKSTKKTLEGRH